jgi:ribosome biogenesis protein SSF1/2
MPTGRKKQRHRRTGKRKKTRTHVVVEYDSKTPRSMVVKRGALAPAVAELVHNIRDVMSPHTTANLKERKSNKLRDFTAIAGPLGVSHCLFVSQSVNFNTTLRICCLPLGE